ncbi:amino acid permease [Calditerricola satsumensis]|uniref:Amino acid permease n=1 Tax=Calditerricola satsumensis TaxID=373054 RepID=A0A8J3BAH7_9BACI|nr:amino acid permease [Calditerricola satsumensis]GGK06459.1 amino acid permease [Calditerricola satsumensis]
MNVWRKKPIAQLLQESEKTSLRRALSAVDLVLLGIGAIIGTGIFVLTGVAAAQHSGPALVLSFILASIAAAFAALSYAEFASAVPISGSVYTYTYVTMGEFLAWIIGWNLILEYTLVVSAVAVGWSGYFQILLSGFGITLPEALVKTPVEGGLFNLPAVAIVLAIAWLLSRGVKESARLNNLIVFLKVGIILLFILVGAFYVKPENWTPFLPFGWSGVLTGAAVVFFAYGGFDAVSSAAEEVKNPKRDLPIGIIGSLAICTLLYIAVSAVLTGMVPYAELNNSAPVAFALQKVGQNGLAGVISASAVITITTVMLVMAYGQTRICFAMSRDGLLPQVFARVHERYKTPYLGTWVAGLAAAALAGFIPLGRLAELVNMGMLTAFVLIQIGVLVLRYKEPDLPRGFRVPGVPYTPILGSLVALFLMFNLSRVTWLAFFIWLGVGLVVYFLYGYRNSTLARNAGPER